MTAGHDCKKCGKFTSRYIHGTGFVCLGCGPYKADREHRAKAAFDIAEAKAVGPFCSPKPFSGMNRSSRRAAIARHRRGAP
jgi:hypothetical protein